MQNAQCTIQIKYEVIAGTKLNYYYYMKSLLIYMRVLDGWLWRYEATATAMAMAIKYLSYGCHFKQDK